MKTSTLRFVTVRNTEPAPPIVCTFPFDPSTLAAEPEYEQSLLKKLDLIHQNTALDPDQKIKAIKDAAAAFKSSRSFISNRKQLEDLHPGFAEFRDWITSKRSLTVKEINREAEKLLRLSVRRTLPAKELLRLTDNLIAYIILNDEPMLREQISFALRINNIVQKAETVRGAADLRKLIAAPVILPDAVFLRPQKQKKPDDTGTKQDPVAAERKQNWEKLNQLSATYDELAQARWITIESVDQPAPKDFTSSNLRREHLASLSKQSLELLKELRITEGMRFTDALAKIENSAHEVAAQIGRSISPFTERVMIGNALVSKSDISAREFKAHQEIAATLVNNRCEFKFPYKIGDLRIVEQELKDYLAGEVAHVENILQGELKERTTRRSRTTEETLFTSSEREETNEKDTQTTTSYQLEKEISNTVKKDTELSVDAKVDTEYYGPVIVKGSVNAGFSTSSSDEQSTRDAVTYAKNVVERSAQKIIERVKEERTLKTTEQFEENNRHLLNNVGGQHHVVGVYRWLNKEYRVWLKNYGKRLMFELFIPEPGAYHIYAMSQKKDVSLGDLKEPRAPNDPEYANELGLPGFALSSHQSITPLNYPIWAAAYGAEVTPPPPAYQIIGGCMGKTSDEDGVHYTEKSDSSLMVPKGYVATQCTITIDFDGNNGWGTLRLGAHVFGPGDNSIPRPMSNETGAIPVMLHGYNRRLVANYEVTCVPLPWTIEEWKIKTYKAIIDAYEAQKAAYQSAVAEARAGAGVVIRGTNPLFNKTIIQTELKKNAIRLMAHCNPLYSSAMVGKEGEFDCCQVMEEAPYIKFVEQVFEWRNMVYEFYPYHWAEKAHWIDLYNLSDTDPFFQNFLKAGYARILVPVTPGYSLAAMNFINLGTPDLNDMASLPVMDIINGMDEDAPTLAPARVSTQTNIDLANPGAIIDGVTMVVGDRVLVRRQTLDSENGVYVWNGSNTAMTRAADADAPTELAQAVVEVTEGTDKGLSFRQTELPLTTIGTDSIIFRIAAEIINESLLIPTELTILECKSAGVDPTSMKILGLCDVAGAMTPVFANSTLSGAEVDHANKLLTDTIDSAHH